MGIPRIFLHSLFVTIRDHSWFHLPAARHRCRHPHSWLHLLTAPHRHYPPRASPDQHPASVVRKTPVRLSFPRDAETDHDPRGGAGRQGVHHIPASVILETFKRDAVRLRQQTARPRAQVAHNPALAAWEVVPPAGVARLRAELEHTTRQRYIPKKAMPIMGKAQESTSR